MNDDNNGNKVNTQTDTQTATADKDKNYDFDLILDIPLNVRAELGQVKMQVNDLLQLGQGSILELEKKVDQQLDVFISDKLVARGEVVIVDEKFGIRLTDIVSPAERVKSLV
jgi:flagellar motor switch protein FliN/FliY